MSAVFVMCLLLVVATHCATLKRNPKENASTTFRLTAQRNDTGSWTAKFGDYQMAIEHKHFNQPEEEEKLDGTWTLKVKHTLTVFEDKEEDEERPNAIRDLLTHIKNELNENSSIAQETYISVPEPGNLSTTALPFIAGIQANEVGAESINEEISSHTNVGPFSSYDERDANEGSVEPVPFTAERLVADPERLVADPEEPTVPMLDERESFPLGLQEQVRNYLKMNSPGDGNKNTVQGLNDTDDAKKADIDIQMPSIDETYNPYRMQDEQEESSVDEQMESAILNERETIKKPYEGEVNGRPSFHTNHQTPVVDEQQIIKTGQLPEREGEMTSEEKEHLLAEEERRLIMERYPRSRSLGHDIREPELKSKGYTHNSEVGWVKLHTAHWQWEQARKACEVEGGHLAIPDTLDKIRAFTRILKNNTDIIDRAVLKNQVFVGVYDPNSSRKFTTVKGEPFIAESVSIWFPNEPNDAHPGEDCITLHLEGKLRDVPCFFNLPFLCQID